MTKLQATHNEIQANREFIIETLEMHKNDEQYTSVALLSDGTLFISDTFTVFEISQKCPGIMIMMLYLADNIELTPQENYEKIVALADKIDRWHEPIVEAVMNGMLEK